MRVHLRRSQICPGDTDGYYHCPQFELTLPLTISSLALRALSYYSVIQEGLWTVHLASNEACGEEEGLLIAVFHLVGDRLEAAFLRRAASIPEFREAREVYVYFCAQFPGRSFDSFVKNVGAGTF